MQNKLIARILAFLIAVALEFGFSVSTKTPLFVLQFGNCVELYGPMLKIKIKSYYFKYFWQISVNYHALYAITWAIKTLLNSSKNKIKNFFKLKFSFYF